MKKILCIGDLHIKPSNLEDQKLLLAEILRVLVLYEVDIIVFLGDILDTHAIVNTQALNFALEVIESVSSHASTFVLMGNHDYLNNQQFLTKNHAFNACKKWPNVVIVDEAINFDGSIGGLTFVPYVPPKRFLEALNTIDSCWRNSKIIFAHQEMFGCFGLEIEGEKWPETYPLLVSGHIHNRLELQKNLIYISTPMQHSFGENEDKGLSLFTINDANITEERILLNVPLKKTVDIDIENIENFEAKTNTYYRLRIRATTPQWLVFQKSKKYKALISENVKIIPVQKDHQEKINNIKKETYFDLMKQFAENKGGHVLTTFTEIYTNMVC